MFTLFISYFSFSFVYWLILMLKICFYPPPFFSKGIKCDKSFHVLFTWDCYLFILATYDDFPGFEIKGYSLLFLLSHLIYIKEFYINQTFILSKLSLFFFFPSGSNRLFFDLISLNFTIISLLMICVLTIWVHQYFSLLKNSLGFHWYQWNKVFSGFLSYCLYISIFCVFLCEFIFYFFRSVLC